MLRARRVAGDDGQLTVLVIGYTFIAAVLVLVGVDVSKVFLARRALSSVADAAALTAAQAVDRAAVYAGAGGCGGLLPIDGRAADDRVAATVDDDLTDLQHSFAVVDQPQTLVAGGTVTVHMSGSLAVPFGSVLSLLDPARGSGRIQVNVTSSAQSPVAAPGGC